MPELLPREATGAARRREEDDLPGLRLSASAARDIGAVSVLRRRLRRGALALGGGVLLYVGHPPVAAGWAGAVALLPLLMLARDFASDGRPIRAGACWGLAAGLTFFLPLLVWLRSVQLEAWPVLAVTQALFVALFVAALAAWGERRWRPAVAVVLWVAVEAARGELPLGGFGWGALGYTQAAGGFFLPLARTLGVAGVGAALAAVAACVEAIVVRALRVLREAEAPRRDAEAVFAAVGAPLGALLLVLVIAVLLGGDPPPSTGRTVDVAAVQGLDIEGSTGRALPRSLLVADLQLDLTRRHVAEAGAPDLVIWPENAIDGDIAGDRAPELRARVEQAAAALDGAPLIAGQILDGPGPGRFRNALALFEGSAEASDRYVKRQYVPFGEYVPFRPLLGWYAPLARVPEDGFPGEAGRVLDVAGARVGPVICFEVLFGNLVHDQVRAGADLLVVATNNSSFGRGAASDQHIAISQLRAVETGRWLLHSALSGKSALVDPEGRATQVTGLYEQAVVRAEVPLVDGRTVATSLGEWPVRITQLLAVVALVWVGWRRRRDPVGSSARPRVQVREDAGTLPPAAGAPAAPDAPVI